MLAMEGRSLFLDIESRVDERALRETPKRRLDPALTGLMPM